MAASDTQPVVLRGGCVVPLAALQLAWSLFDRGFSLTPEGDRLLVRPPCCLNEPCARCSSVALK